jgi:hypothetical protein
MLTYLECTGNVKTKEYCLLSLHMTAKDVDIFGMYLVVDGNETEYVKENTFLLLSYSFVIINKIRLDI